MGLKTFACTTPEPLSTSPLDQWLTPNADSIDFGMAISVPVQQHAGCGVVNFRLTAQQDALIRKVQHALYCFMHIGAQPLANI